MSEFFVGIDIGGTNTNIGCFDSNVNLIAKLSIPTKAEMGPDLLVDGIGQAVENLLAEQHLTIDAVGGIGIGAPGPVNLAEGTIIAAPNLPLFKGVPLRKMISQRLGEFTVFENDANAACWGEYVIGAGRGADDMVFFTLGTGIGGAIVSNGKLVHGFNDSAGEPGHMIIYPDGRLCGCGQRGCVEAYASANSTAARALEAINSGAQSSLKTVLEEKGQISCRNIYEHLAAGDKLAKEITDGTAKALALMCVNMVHVTAPQRIVFAGGMIAAGELLLNRTREFFDKYIWTLKQELVEICFATLGEDAGIIGAAALVIHALKKGESD